MFARLDTRHATIEASQKGTNQNDMPPFKHDRHDNFDRVPGGGPGHNDMPPHRHVRLLK